MLSQYPCTIARKQSPKEVMATILVIEDNAETMKLTGLVMRWSGHRVLSAADAETGIALARTGRPDLIIMDVVLSGMDGLTATQLLKKDPLTAGIPVIALTWQGSKNDEEKARAAGCDAYITKPFLRQHLDETIKALLNSPKTPDAKP
jgi:two-component system cell cycle response regulator DivK